ncbi:organic solvent tolerance protein OstA precursor, partial [Pseudomonas aeruginosa ATCC 25324]
FRYLTHSSEGMVTAAYLNDKDDHRENFPDYSKDRWLYGLKNTTGLDSRWLAEVDYTRISDPYYFQDLDTDLGVGSTTYVNQRGTLTYRGDTFTGRLNAQAYQLATTTDVTPYDRLPQITFDGFLPYNPGGMQFTYGTEFVRFDRDLDENIYFNDDGSIRGKRPDASLQGLARATGDRMHLEPGMSLPMTRSWGYVTPTLKYLYTKYDLDLDSQGKTDLNKRDESFDSNQDRSLPLVKVDSGLYFDRDTTFAGTPFRQTLEPRAMYLYVPYKDQDSLPVFDTSEPSFSYDSLWRENRFTGKDRIGDANQLSLGVTSRFIEENGFERASISAGQIYYFRDRRVQLPGLTEKDLKRLNLDPSGLDNDSWRSPYAFAGQYRFNRDWRINSDFNWNPNTSRTESGSAIFHYQPEVDPGKVVNVGYRYRADARRFDSSRGTFRYGNENDIIKQHDFSVIWPLVPQWSVLARWQYDYNKNRTLEAFGGFEYDSCCWKLRLINRYWLDVDDDAFLVQSEKADRGIFLQIVLKGLGGIVGNKTEMFLDKGIQGYRQREDQAM